MKLSVIVPVYNCITFLPKLSETIAEIHCDDYEVILVDDGSLDGSSAFCDKIAAQNHHVRVLHKPNGGVSSARNAGLDIARGTFIGFLDADDGVSPHMFSRLIASAQKYDSDLVMGGYEKDDVNNKTPVSIPFNELITEASEIKKIAWSMAFWNAWIDGDYYPTVYGSVWPNLYRRDLIRNHHIQFPEGIAIGEDLLFNLIYLSHAGTVSVVNEPLYRYNIANSSATRKQNKTLWQRYSTLLDWEKTLLNQHYGSGEDLEYNLHRQRINYAINVGEEQICVFMKCREAKNALKELCSDPKLQLSAKYIMRYGKGPKERIQAALFRGKLAGVIWHWLK